VAINRIAAIDYAKEFWNRVTDDNKIAISSGEIHLDDKRKLMHAPASDGWQGYFVYSRVGGERAVFLRTVGGKIEMMEPPIASQSDIDDCTHYVCRCLMKEGIPLRTTSRANELAEQMIKSRVTKVLALKASQADGQRVIDTGAFKPGDLISYWLDQKGRYSHSAMFVGKESTNDPGGITCHSVCRYRGLTKAWSGIDEDAWFLHDGYRYTLIHFSEDDAIISPSTRKWLPGWWQVGSDYYFVRDNGHAFSTHTAPKNAREILMAGNWVGYYFDDGGRDITFVWRKPAGQTQVEHWTAPLGNMEVSARVNGVPVNVRRYFR